MSSLLSSVSRIGRRYNIESVVQQCSTYTTDLTERLGECGCVVMACYWGRNVRMTSASVLVTKTITDRW